MRRYTDDTAALGDVLRLSRAMSYKLALLEVPAGGAKAVILGDPRCDKTPHLLAAVGRAVDALGGRFIAGEDVGIEAADLRAMGTRWMTPSPDSAEAAAEGVLACLKRAVRERLRRDDLDGLRVAVQGVGRVGGGLARRLSAEGARLVLADLDAARAAGLARELSATAVPAEKIFDAEVDVFAPCALGGAVDSARLRCAVICGGANNQLVRPSLAEELAAKNILYVPDFVANAGGILGAGAARLGDVLDGVFHRAARDGITPLAAAERIARERFRAMGGEL